MDTTAWAKSDPKGRAYCRSYHFDRCSGGCGRTHNCPWRTPTGEPCNQVHKARDCPHFKAAA